MKLTVKIPKRFVQDHAKRNLLRSDEWNEGSVSVALMSVIVKETKSHFFVTLTNAQAKELMSDAHYYTYESDQRDIGLRSSAKATCNALVKAGIAQPSR